MKREIEVKFSADPGSTSLFQHFLQQYARHEACVAMREIYFDRVSDGFRFIDSDGYIDARVFLRVRFSEQGDSVCLKDYIPDESGKLSSCDEFEFEVSEGQEAVRLIQALGYTEQFEIEKVRDIYVLDNFEISCDEIAGIGSFFEVEIIDPADISVSDGIEAIYRLIRRSGLSIIKTYDRGYLSMKWNPNKNYGVIIDLTKF